MRDCHGDVTRDRSVTMGVTDGVTFAVSHAPHTAPLYTLFFGAVACGVSGYPSIRRQGLLGAAARIGWMA